MSRIGRMPIKIEDGATLSQENGVVTIEGKLGALSQAIENKNIVVCVNDGFIEVQRLNEQKETKAAHGLYRALLANMMQGVTKGFEKRLILSGVGYKSQISGKNLILNVGYSHPVTIAMPEGVTFECAAPTEVVVKGIDKVAVGQAAANIKAVRKPEPYHGYGIRYKDETILRKEGKTAGK